MVKILYTIFIYIILLLILLRTKPLYLFDEYGYYRDSKQIIVVIFLLLLWCFLFVMGMCSSFSNCITV